MGMEQNYNGFQPSPLEYGTLNIDLNTAFPLNDYVIIKLPSDYKDDVRKTEGGLLVSSVANKEAAYPRYGEIKSVANGCKFSKVGDRAFFNYLTLHQCRLEGTAFEISAGEAYIFLSEKVLHFLVRGGEYVMLNGWCLMRPVMKGVKDVVVGGIILEQAPVDTHYPDRAVMVAKPADFEDVGIGDLCVLEKDCDIPVEYEWNQTIERLFRVAQQNIIGVCEGEDFSMKY